MVWMAAFLTLFVIANIAVMYMWFCQRALERSLNTHREIALFPDIARAPRTPKPGAVYTAPASARTAAAPVAKVAPVAAGFVSEIPAAATPVMRPTAKTAKGKTSSRAKTVRAPSVSAAPKTAVAKPKAPTVQKAVMAKASSSKAASPKVANPKTATAKSSAADEISLISGVGPALSKKLAGAGVTSLKQIAKMSPTKLAALDAELKLGGRTASEEWIEQAKELSAGLAPRAKIDQKAVK